MFSTQMPSFHKKLALTPSNPCGTPMSRSRPLPLLRLREFQTAAWADGSFSLGRAQGSAMDVSETIAVKRFQHLDTLAACESPALFYDVLYRMKACGIKVGWDMFGKDSRSRDRARFLQAARPQKHSKTNTPFFGCFMVQFIHIKFLFVRIEVINPGFQAWGSL